MCRLLIVFVLFFGSLHSFAGVVAVNGQYPCNVEMPSAGALGQCYVDRVRVFGSRVLGFTRDSNKSLRLKLENGQRPWLYFSGQDDAPEPEDKYCDTAAGKGALSSAISACMDNPPMGYENTHSYSCSNQAKAILGGCNSKPIDKPCTGDACSGSGGDGDSGDGGDGGSSSGGGSSGGDGGSSSGGGSSGGDGSGNGGGNKGEKGDKGDKGDTGEAGKDGIDGEKGTDGIDGINGKDGINGADGRDGVDGLNGSNGRDGVDGERGASGKNGIDGVNGLNAEPADLRPVLNSISSLKSFNASEFNSAAASRRNLSSSLDSISALTSGLGGNIDALKVSNKNALSDVKNATDSLGAKSDEQTAYQKIIADKMAELNDSFGVGIPELDKKSERNNQLLDDIKKMTETNADVLTAENQAQLDKAFAQFDETKKQTDLLSNIKELTAELGDNSVTDNELKSVNDKLAQMNNQLSSSNNKLDSIDKTLSDNDKKDDSRTAQLLAGLANNNAQGESRWREMRDQYKQGNDDLIDAVGGVEGAIDEQTDRLLETGLTAGGVNGTANKSNGIVDGIMDDALGQYVEAIESSTDDIALNESSFSVLQDRFNALVGVNSTCVSMKFGMLNITCEASDRFKQYFGFILYFLTMLTLYDILFTGITPDPARAPGRKRF
ncbi:collagen-like protein [Photobacterium profundum]|uniref:Uncharacterized protein n=1 Tax=Photobacterium profundum 3TCK TaxID=314280 RepID=Q1Z9G8_9GAMM|nr:collagen-like protein [Photobacterium profundum]EAS44790.1 hypothetical protein P3TCK_19940 [Photobacterium profundum 3TCK]PSV59311.1 collagen-like protein [Photobacterium profundum]